MAGVSVFRNLNEKYQTWDSLKQYLTSEEGGNFEVRDCENTPFAIIKYKRNVSNVAGENGWLRSVVWQTEKNMPICVSPKKANEGVPPVNTEFEIQNIIDGVMINVFMCLEADGSTSYHVASRSNYGAKGNFYSKKSFAELFQDALVAMGYGSLEKFVPQTCLPSLEFPSTFISLVLQHPEHRIVVCSNSPSIVIVEAGKISTTGDLVKNVNLPPNQAIHCLDRRSFASEQEIFEYMREASHQHGWRWPGLMFHDTQGNRWRMHSETYTYLRGLRGNDAVPESRFLRLRSTGHVREYLKHYSEERQLFWDLETKFRQRTGDVYNAYVAVHKSHEKKLVDIPQPDKTIVFKLHAHFLANMREQKKKIRLADVVDLVNSLPLWEQALLLKQG